MLVPDRGKSEQDEGDDVQADDVGVFESIPKGPLMRMARGHFLEQESPLDDLKGTFNAGWHPLVEQTARIIEGAHRVMARGEVCLLENEANLRIEASLKVRLGAH